MDTPKLDSSTIARQGPESQGTTGEVAVHPVTGEVLGSIETLPPEVLAETLWLVRERVKQLREMDGVLQDELRRRMEIRGRRIWVTGEFGLEVESGREAIWDVDGLEAELRRLIDDGVLQARELTGVLTHETVVHRSELNKVLGRLSGPAHAALTQYRTWRRKGGGPGRVRVERQQALISQPTEGQQ